MIKVINNPSDAQLNERGIHNWPIWTKEISTFPWSYDSEETCFFLEGEVEVIPENGQPVCIAKGDLVTFPKGMSCTWVIKKPVRKHYSFADEGD